MRPADSFSRAETKRRAMRHGPMLPDCRQPGAGTSANRQVWSTGSYDVSKRTVDIATILILTPLIIPLMMLCAALVKLDTPKEPIFFRQERTGKNGWRFVLYKFRTMVSSAELMKENYLNDNLLTWPDFKMNDDPRVTNIGKFLRKTSLDELPQILNVLRGDMSLVGPRPTSFDASTYKCWHTERLEVKPGLTGLWQVKGRGRIDFDDRVRLDIRYIKHRSLWLDFKLILMTLPVLLAGD